MHDKKCILVIVTVIFCVQFPTVIRIEKLTHAIVGQVRARAIRTPVHNYMYVQQTQDTQAMCAEPQQLTQASRNPWLQYTQTYIIPVYAQVYASAQPVYMVIFIIIKASRNPWLQYTQTYIIPVYAQVYASAQPVYMVIFIIIKAFCIADFNFGSIIRQIRCLISWSSFPFESLIEILSCR